ncbi:MAG: hypothetical protein ACR2RB_01485 [Gammaproteobacteria bacterium]
MATNFIPPKFIPPNFIPPNFIPVDLVLFEFVLVDLLLLNVFAHPVVCPPPVVKRPSAGCCAHSEGARDANKVMMRSRRADAVVIQHGWANCP